jgi:hypothetical protein
VFLARALFSLSLSLSLFAGVKRELVVCLFKSGGHTGISQFNPVIGSLICVRTFFFDIIHLFFMNGGVPAGWSHDIFQFHGIIPV